MCYSALVKQDIDFLCRVLGATLVRVQYDDYINASTKDPKRFPPLAKRIHRGQFAPVVYWSEKHGKRSIALMRYGVHLPNQPYNARRENLSSPFWRSHARHRRGIVAVDGFYEQVPVRELIKAGTVSLDKVREEFASLSEKRRAKVESQGKKHQPTATELKDPLDRNIEVLFRPSSRETLWIPVVFDYAKVDGKWCAGFAIVTDRPPSEVEATGHSRCPSSLSESEAAEWLQPGRRNIDKILGSGRRPTFEHDLGHGHHD